MKGLCNIADRVLICGCGITQEEAEEDHDETLHNVLMRMQQVELKLNPAFFILCFYFKLHSVIVKFKFKVNPLKLEENV